MNNKNNYVLVSLALASLGLANSAGAEVSASEAARLNKQLTPMGAERAGNADGSIPAWTGGLIQPANGPTGRRSDPFANEKPLFTITATNASQYRDHLTEGTLAMIYKYPDTFKVNVYPSHRTAAAPQWVYDNTMANATRATLVNNAPTNAYGGIPFPIPQSGAEVIWNHALRWRGEDTRHMDNWYQTLADGRRVLITEAVIDEQIPYYFEGETLESYQKRNDPFWKVLIRNTGPAIRAGQALLAHEHLDQNKTQTWVYLTGQRRVRKLPNACCDTPTPAAAGEMTFDEMYVWTGRLDRFDWEIVGKQEKFVPYNANGFMQPKSDDEVFDKHHYKTDLMRWEKHRVWVVEGKLRKGERHQVSRTRYYCDEDTWICVLGDRWDANGQLWKTLWSQTFVAPELPGVIMGAFGLFDLIEGTSFTAQVANEKDVQFGIMKRRSPLIYTPDALSGSSVR